MTWRLDGASVLSRGFGSFTISHSSTGRWLTLANLPVRTMTQTHEVMNQTDDLRPLQSNLTLAEIGQED